MSKLKQTYIFLFFVGWFFFPFNDFEGVKALGEFKNEAGAFFFFAGFLLMVVDSLKTAKIGIPYRSKIFKLLVLFLLWCVVTILLNFNAVSESFFKHTSGMYRFLRQYISLLISTIIFLVYFWNVIRNMTLQEVLLRIRKILLYSLIFVFVYGFLETMIIVFNVHPLRPILALFDYFPFLDVNYPPGERISSVAYESPSLGNYLITVSGWMFSYIFTERNKFRFLPALMVLFLMYFSGSRTALINIMLQFCILFYVMYKMPTYRKNVVAFFRYGFLISALFLVINGEKIVKSVDEKIESLNFSENLKKNVSNQSRFGMQYASIQVFKEHPIVGVGFGQETYYKRFHYPAWAKKNNYEFRLLYENKNERSFPSAYNLYTRLLAETGIIGFGIWLLLIYLCISNSALLFRKGINETKALGLILLISFVGLSLNWLQTDFFRQYGFWLCMVILIKALGSSKPAEIGDSAVVFR